MKRAKRLPQAAIDKLVRRHLEGNESVAALAKEGGVGRAGFYLWVKDYKEQVMRRAMRSDMSPQELEKRAKADLIAEIESLRVENRKLRDRLVAEMMKN
jgi:hypothetical protein